MARPSRWPERIEIYVTRAENDALRAHAIREGRPVADIARRAITAEIERLNTLALERK